MSWLDRMIAFTVQQDGSTVGTQQTINLQGLTATNDTTNNRVNITSKAITVDIGVARGSDYTLSAAEAAAPNLIISGSWDGGGYSVIFPSFPFANQSVSTVTNLTDQAFAITLGATSYSVDTLSTVQLSWIAPASMDFVRRSPGRYPFMVKFNVAAGVATLAAYSDNYLSSASAAKNAAGDFTVTLPTLPVSVVAAQLTPNTTAGLDPKAVITGANTVRCYMTADSDFTLVFWLSF